MAQTPSGDYLAGNPYTDQDGDIHVNNSTVYLEVADIVTATTEGATIKGIYSTTISVTVPSITDPDIAKVSVDVSAMTFTPVIGDLVIAQPIVALPTNCRYQGAWVSDTNTVEIVYGSEGGNVTGAAKNHTFLFIDLT